MLYREIIVQTTHEGADFVSDAFFSLGVTGVAVRDPSDIAETLADKRTWDYADESLLKTAPSVVEVSGFVSADATEQKIAALNLLLDEWEGIVDLSPRLIRTRDYDDVDWREEWRKYYKPIPAGAFTVVPEWLPIEKESGIPIRIDPGMAFGTGEHESTKMCLILLSSVEVQRKRVIDVGTGSGILGIGAALKGAAEVDMCDLDSLSVTAAKKNAALNGVEKITRVQEGDLTEHASGKYSLALANLTADILLRLAPQLPAVLEEGGVLIASGIIHGRLDEVVVAFEREGFRITEKISLGEWDAIQAQKGDSHGA